MKQPSPNTRKLLALAILLNVRLRTKTNGDFKLVLLQKQCDNAMAVYYLKNRDDYKIVKDTLFSIIDGIQEKHNNILNKNELSLYIELLCTLVPKVHFKTFFNIIPYTTMETIKQEQKQGITDSIVALDTNINNALGTKQSITLESITLVLNKPEQIIKQSRTRDVKTAKKTKKLRNAIKYRRNKNIKENK